MVMMQSVYYQLLFDNEVFGSNFYDMLRDDMNAIIILIKIWIVWSKTGFFLFLSCRPGKIKLSAIVDKYF